MPTTVGPSPEADVARVARVPLAGLEAGERELDAKTWHYLRDILRLRAFEPFVVFDPESELEADARLTDGVARRCVLDVPRTALRIPSSGIVLVQALGKGDKTEQVVRSATALGVAEVHLVETERSVARIGERSDNKRARWQAIARDAARQSGRSGLPQIVGPHPLSLELDTWRERTALKLCLSPGAPHTLHAALSAWEAGAPVALLIGPEGGLAPHEVTCAEQAGFLPTRFGSLVLRTEIAAVAVLGALLSHADR
jgi:16S rRNA (uracil1498-N3)-methyltransferase